MCERRHHRVISGVMTLWRRSFLLQGLLGLTAALSPIWVRAGRASSGKASSGPASSAAPGSAPSRLKLRVQPTRLQVLGREVTILSILNPGGGRGLELDQAAGFHVEVINHLQVPTGVHWHGLVLPNGMDGVPFVTQKPIPPGASESYDFPLKQSGTYWMHAHYGLQEQHLLAAPLVIWSPRERALAARQFVVMISDFSFRSPQEILKQLRSSSGMGAMEDMAGMKEGMGGMAMAGTAPRGTASAGMAQGRQVTDGMAMAGMTMAAPARSRAGTPALAKVLQQVWDAAGGRLTSQLAPGRPGSSDVKYDALLANHRSIDDAEILVLQPGQTVLLRLIGGCCATNVYIDTGSLEATVLATDGSPCQPLQGNFFQLAIAQRLDLHVTMPQVPGVFPLLIRAEGRELLAAVVLSSAGAGAGAQAVAALPRKAAVVTAGLNGQQESGLKALASLPSRPVDRQLELVLAGTMHGYQWTINGAAYPNHNSLLVRQGERVAIHLKNTNGMGHPMHLHGHVFQVVEINGQALDGPLRDTVLVPAGGDCVVILDANQPGIWAFHCHILYHAETGMFTVLRYEGADTRFWQPEQMAAAMEQPALGS